MTSRQAAARTAQARFMRRGAACTVGFALLLGQAVGGAGEPADALPYSTSYLITGNYVAGGVDVASNVAEGGFVTGTLHMGTTPANTVPANAEILAAFLYWESIYGDAAQITGMKFRGIPLPTYKVAHRPLTQDTPCWATGSNLTMAMFRADVLPFLPAAEDAAGRKNGRRLVNDADLTANGWALHTVTLPQAQGNQVPESAGASLVVVYRDPTEPLRKIVLYDGIFVQPQGAGMAQTLRGFYQSAATKSARLTHILGSGAKNHSEQLFFNSTQIQPGVEPFVETGASADRSWFTKTLDHATIDPLMALDAPNTTYGETATTGVTHTSTSPYECLAWAAVVFSTAVADVDHDGLPDGLEDAADGLQNPNGEPLPNLNAMGARSTADGVPHPDLFVEFNGMTAAAGLTYGGGPADPGHDHLPTPEVLKMVGDVYSSHGITPHFDVGAIENYHTSMGGGAAANTADAYLVSTGARGGERIAEAYCVESATVHCEFPAYPGTVGWKSGFQTYRDAPVGAQGQELSQAQQDQYEAACDAAAVKTDANCRRRFDSIRDGLFHYALYAHARARPKSTFPCLDGTTPTEYAKDALGRYTGACAGGATNPNFSIPKSISGTADLPGGGLMITLGLWGDAATPFVTASTTLHELGHNLSLWHGGVPAVIGSATAGTQTYIEPNCKPNYLSSMSYLFQVHGMFTDEDGDGDGFPDEIPHMDYSDQQLGTIGENALHDDPFSVIGPAPAFRPAWFVPVSSDLAVVQGLTTAAKYCNGSKFPFLPGGTKPTGWVDMARAVAPVSTAAIDWDGDLQTGDTTFDRNVNFDGTPLDEKTLQGGVAILTPPSGTALYGFNDWSHVRLDQIGAGRASGQFKKFNGSSFEGSSFEGSSFEGSSFEGSSFEGSSFEGSSFEGSSFEGSSFEGSSFEGSSFEGSSFEGSSFEGSSFEGSSFEGSSFEGSSFEGSSFEGQELDLTTANSFGRSAPHGLKACVIGRDTNCDDGDASHYHRVLLRWKRPTFGSVSAYHLFRLRGSSVTPAGVSGATEVTNPATGTTATEYTDATELPDNEPFIWFVKATFSDDPPGTSGNSNFAKTTAVNEAPAANGDGAYSTPQDTPLTITLASLLANDTDADSPSAPGTLQAVVATPATTYGPAHGTVTLNAAGTAFIYTPNPGYSGPDSFTYNANDGVWTDAGGTVPMSPDSNPGVTIPITVIDTKVPVVTLGATTPAPNTGGWNNSPVTIQVTAVDASGITAINCTDSIAGGAVLGPLSGTTTATATLTVSGDGTHNLVCTATDGAVPPNSGAGAGSANTRTVRIDATAPGGPTITSPTEGAEFTVSSVTVQFSSGESGVTFQCKLDGDAYASCSSPKQYTGLSVGSHTFSVKATDAAGNVGAAATRTFKVVWTFTASPPKTPSNLGSAVPLNFTLKDPQGNFVTTLSAGVPLVEMKSVFNGATVPPGGCVPSATGTPTTLYSPATGATGGSDLRFISPGYRFNWNTSTATATGKGCYSIVVTLSDGSAQKLFPYAVQLK